ncbi:MAG TPA: lysophospholipid acyltransferase family protein [Bacteroidota bacterium]|nr:lysophospholipid acyltransferase family protein [Bacteroidota bacterium]
MPLSHPMIISALRVFFVVLITVLASSVMVLVFAVNHSERVYFSLVKSYFRLILAVCGIRVEVLGAERINLSQNYVFVANHGSLFDIPAVIAGIPSNVRLIYKKELERVPFIGWALYMGRTYIAINRSQGQEAMRSMEEAARTIARGASVLVFGEGTRTTDGKLQPFKRGAFRLAVQAGIPVVPLTINGSYRILPKGSLSPRPGSISLVVDNPIIPPGANGKDAELHLLEQVRETIERNYREY